MPIEQLLPYLTGAAGFLLALYTFIERRRDNQAAEIAKIKENLAQEVARLLADIAKLREELAGIKTQTGVFWKLAEAHLATMLHKPTHVERDRLLEKIQARQHMTEAECKRLIELLEDIVEEREPTTPDEKLAAILLMARMESRLAASKAKSH
jgi:HD-GYP domain-containing protein (c-di-GMP phosphodiesterase class II)